MPIVIKRGDTGPPVVATLKKADGSGLPITGATVLFIMAQRDPRTVVVSSPASIVDAAAGVVQYDWQEGDTDTAGEFDAEFEVTYADGKVQSCPTRGFISCTITPDLGGA